MADMSYTVPTELRAGDSATWTRQLPDYPAGDGWTLQYFLSDQTHTITITSTAVGDDHLVSLTPSGSASWVPGVYRIAEFVTKGTPPTDEKHTISDGSIRILPDLSTNVAYDTRTDARIIYDQLIAAYKSYVASNGHLKEYEIAGRRTIYKTTTEILDQIKYWAQIVRDEDAAAAIAQGKPNPRRVGIRFNRI